MLQSPEDDAGLTLNVLYFWTLVSVVMTGVLSMILFGTHLSVMYGLGIVNVVIAVLLYNGNRETLDRFVC